MDAAETLLARLHAHIRQRLASAEAVATIAVPGTSAHQCAVWTATEMGRLLVVIDGGEPDNRG